MSDAPANTEPANFEIDPSQNDGDTPVPNETVPTLDKKRKNKGFLGKKDLFDKAINFLFVAFGALLVIFVPEMLKSGNTLRDETIRKSSEITYDLSNVRRKYEAIYPHLKICESKACDREDMPLEKMPDPQVLDQYFKDKRELEGVVLDAFKVIDKIDFLPNLEGQLTGLGNTVYMAMKTEIINDLKRFQKDVNNFLDCLNPNHSNICDSKADAGVLTKAMRIGRDVHDLERKCAIIRLFN